MAAYSLIKNKMGEKTKYLMIGVSVARLFFDKSIYAPSFLLDFLSLLAIWGILVGFFKGILDGLSRRVFSKKIRAADLKEGMILNESINRISKVSKLQVSQLRKMDGTEIAKGKKSYYVKGAAATKKSIIGQESEGLSKDEVKMIKSLGFKSLEISNTIPFSPFVFLGVLLTIIANGNILIYAANII
jgi:prepilin signal peptidase PulO-like enzyme (type II secretory pathway)